MQRAGRLRLRPRPWLEEQVQSGRYPGVRWVDQSAQIFQIPWIHAARYGWSMDRDATLFRSWAVHTGRHRPGRDEPDPKTWKANFRCALNSLRDVCELPERRRRRGGAARRVYRMRPGSRRRGRTGQSARSSSQGGVFSERPRETRPSLGDGAHAAQPRQPAERPAPGPRQEAETPERDTMGNAQTHGTWEVKPEDQKQNEAVFKLMDRFSNVDVWNQTGEQRGRRAHTLWDHWHCTAPRAGGEHLTSLHTETGGDPFGPNDVKELSDWPMHHTDDSSCVSSCYRNHI